MKELQKYLETRKLDRIVKQLILREKDREIRLVSVLALLLTVLLVLQLYPLFKALSKLN